MDYYGSLFCLVAFHTRGMFCHFKLLNLLAREPCVLPSLATKGWRLPCFQLSRLMTSFGSYSQVYSMIYTFGCFLSDAGNENSAIGLFTFDQLFSSFPGFGGLSALCAYLPAPLSFFIP